MKDELVSFKVSKLAKEKGFNEETYAFYDSTNTLINPLAAHKESNWTRHIILNKYNDGFVYNSTTGNKVNNYAAPTQSLLQKWLREKHNIHIHLEYIGEGSYYIEATNFDSEVNIFMDNLYGTYEDILNIILEISIETIN